VVEENHVEDSTNIPYRGPNVHGGPEFPRPEYNEELTPDGLNIDDPVHYDPAVTEPVPLPVYIVGDNARNGRQRRTFRTYEAILNPQSVGRIAGQNDARVSITLRQREKIFYIGDSPSMTKVNGFECGGGDTELPVQSAIYGLNDTDAIISVWVIEYLILPLD